MNLPDEPSFIPPQGGWTRERIVFVGISAVLSVALLIAVRQVLLPFILALIIAYVLTPLVAWCEARGKMPRAVAIIAVYFVVLGTVTVSMFALAPRLYDETLNFAREVPNLTHEISHKQGPKLEKWLKLFQGKPAPKQKKGQGALLIHKRSETTFEVEVGRGLLIVEQDDGVYKLTTDEPRPQPFSAQELIDDGVDRFVRFAQVNAMQFLKLGQTIVASISRFVLLLFMTLMVAGYVMATRESILAFFKDLVPRIHQPGFDLLMLRVDRGLSGVVRGQLLICAVNGVLSAIGFAVFGLKYWPVLAVLAGVMSIIPIFGSILSTIPAVLIGLTQDIWIALWVLIWILAIHQIEANLLNPKIIGVAAKIHPVLVVFALLVGEHFFGLFGALLAVPVLSVTQSVFNHFRFGLPDAEADSLAASELLARQSQGR